MKEKSSALYVWQPLDTTEPARAGKYLVAHRGQMVGAAHFLTHNIGAFNIQGWQYLPSWKPTHWMAIMWMP